MQGREQSMVRPSLGSPHPDRPSPTHSRASPLPHSMQTLARRFLHRYSSNRVCTWSEAMATSPRRAFEMAPLQRHNTVLPHRHARNRRRHHLPRLQQRLASSLQASINFLLLPFFLRQNHPPPISQPRSQRSRRRFLVPADFS